MSNVIGFKAYKNTLKRDNGYAPVSGENGYSVIRCVFPADGDWDNISAVSAGFFVHPKDIAVVTGTIATEEIATGGEERAAEFTIPGALLKQGERLHFGLFATVNDVTIATNTVVLDVARGIVSDDIDYDPTEAANMFEQFSNALNTALLGKADKVTRGNVAGTVLTANSNGNIQSSGYIVDNVRLGAGIPTSSVVQQALNGKADKVAAGTDRELAALDANGALKRSGFTVAESVDEGSNSMVPTTAAVKTALDDAEDTTAENIDWIFQGNSAYFPQLYFEQYFTANGSNYRLIYDDRDGERHVLFDFGLLNVPTKTSELTNDSGYIFPVCVDSIDACTQPRTLYYTVFENRHAYVFNTDTADSWMDGKKVYTDIIRVQYVFVDGKIRTRDRMYHDDTASWSEWSTWEEIGGGSQIVSGVVNQNGTITFTDSDGNTFTTSGASVIGPQGAPGDDYVLTPQDKADIADIVLQELPTTQGVLYGN